MLHSMFSAMFSAEDKMLLQELGKQLNEIAHSSDNLKKMRLWKSLRALQPERPMFVVDKSIFRYIVDKNPPESLKLHCKDEFLRSIEKNLRLQILQAKLGDDFVVCPFLEIPWDIEISDYGVPLIMIKPSEDSIASTYEFPILSGEDAKKLVRRNFSCNRESSAAKKAILDDIFDGILDIRLCGPDYMRNEMTKTLYSLIGMENMMIWLYDEPELFHYLTNYLCEDKERFFKWLEGEKLLSLNNENQYSGGGSPGFIGASVIGATSDNHPQKNHPPVALRDLWCWTESQETLGISPAMYTEFILPYLSRLAKLFAHVYYGCCEPLHDRIHYIKEAFPNLKAVSVSPWSDKEKVAESLSTHYVYSSKPMPSFLSGHNPDWDMQKKEVDEVLSATRKHNCKLEFILRDVYDVGGDDSRLGDWADMMRAQVGF